MCMCSVYTLLHVCVEEEEFFLVDFSVNAISSLVFLCMCMSRPIRASRSIHKVRVYTA